MSKKVNIFQNIFITILLIIISFLLIFSVTITANDELWTFQNIYKMFNGFKIYVDSNVITTPLFFYIGNLLFKLLKANFFIYRIYNTIIYLVFFYLIFKILKNLNVCKNLNLLYTVFAILFIFQLVPAGANYNTLAIVFSLIGLNLYASKKSNNVLQGFLFFLVFFTKQTTGILYILSVLIYELYIEKFSKKYILNQLKKFATFLVPSSIVLLKLYFDNNLIAFLNYCFGGIFEFGRSNLVFSASAYYICIPVITLFLYILMFSLKNTVLKEFSDEFFKNLTLLFIFAIVHTFVVYPIINIAHVLLTFPFHLIFMFYCFDTLIFKELFSDEHYKTKINWFSIIILLIVILRIGINFFNNYSTIELYTSESPFKGMFIGKDDIEKMQTLENYIKEKNANNIDVIIFSYESAFPMVELKQSHGAYDLLFNGNLGYNGKEKIKNDILNRKDTEFWVVTDEADLFEQEPPEIRQFIIDNLDFKGTICNYSIYGK